MKTSLPCLIALLCASNTLAAEWDYPANAVTVTQAQEAKRYLDQTYPEQGEYTLRYTTESKLGTHYNFNVWIEGEYQQQKAMVVSTNRDGQVVRVFKSLENTVINDGKPTTAAELEAPRSLKARTPPALKSGTLVNATLNVFDPDLRTMDRNPTPSSQMKEVADYPNPPQYTLKNSEVLASGGQYYLSNNQVRQVDALALVTPANNGKQAIEDNSGMLAEEGVVRFSSLAELNAVTVNDNNFTQVMAFTHLDHSVKYINSLGFTVFTQPVDFDARGLVANNSTYYYGAKAMLLGVGGGSPDALDADVILHELGHGIHYHIVPDWAYGHTGAIGEGFGDYWAGSYSYRQQFQNANASGQEFEIDTVFNWDGYFATQKSTRSLWNQRARYFKNAHYRAHESVAGELGDELWSTPLFQSLKQSVALYGENAFTEFDALVLESMYGLGRGLKMHDLAESMIFTANTLYPSKEYARILTDNFMVHSLLLAPFKQEVKQRYIQPNSTPLLTLSPTQRQAAISGEVLLNGTLNQSINHDAFEQLTLNLTLPNSATCGSIMNVETRLNYQFNDTLQEHSWLHTEKMINGTPSLNVEIPTINSRIPDAKIDNSGRPIVGLQTLNFTSADRNAVVDDSFGVYLNLEHSNLIDLTVTLISPRGTRVMLLNHKDTNQTEFNDYFTIQHDDILNALQGEPSWGTWRLEVADFTPNESGKLIAWGVGAISEYQCSEHKVVPSTPSSGGGTSLITLFCLFLFWNGRQLSLHKD